MMKPTGVGSVCLPSRLVYLQLVSCLGMLLESWNPFPVDEGSRGAQDHKEMATRNVRTDVLCGYQGSVLAE